MSDRLKIVELHAAYSWDCEECGRENFCRAIVADMPPEEKLAALQSMGILEPHQTLEDLENRTEDGGKSGGDLMTRPDVVQCAFCHCKFSAIDDREERDDQE